jgi:hypothetical protein
MYHLFFVRLRTAMGMLPYEKTNATSDSCFGFAFNR